MKQAARMRDRVEILSLQEADGSYAWVPSKTTYATAEKTGKRNLFSAVGAGREEYLFTLRRQPLALDQALRWRGRFCFLSDLSEPDRGHITARCALAEPSDCMVQRTKVSTDNPMNRPQRLQTETVRFPAILTEKYVKATPEDWSTVTETAYVLVTPKAVSLHTGETVSVGGAPFVVQVGHLLDEYKNEYEILRKVDA